MKHTFVKGVQLSDQYPKQDIIDTSSDVLVNNIDRDRDEFLGFPLSQYNLNYTFDKKDPRDYKFSSLLYKDIDPNALPAKVDLRSNWGEIFDQGSLGSCVANSVSYQIRFLLRKQNQTPRNSSRLFIYYNGRRISGYPIAQDTGLTLRNGFQSVTASGAPTEDIWSYVISNFAVKPPDAVYAEGNKYKTFSYYSVAQNELQMKKCLKDGFLISFGMGLYESFMTSAVATNGMVPIPNQSREARSGGHAMTIVGYDDSIKRFIVANSWGRAWGDNGFCYIPYQMLLDTAMSGDFWTGRVFGKLSPTPSPTPSPAPAPAPAPAPSPTPTPAPTPSPTAIEWAPNVNYSSGAIVTYIGGRYKCNIGHRSLSVWTPSAVPALWTRIG